MHQYKSNFSRGLMSTEVCAFYMCTRTHRFWSNNIYMHSLTILTPAHTVLRMSPAKSIWTNGVCIWKFCHLCMQVLKFVISLCTKVCIAEMYMCKSNHWVWQKLSDSRCQDIRWSLPMASTHVYQKISQVKRCLNIMPELLIMFLQSARFLIWGSVAKPSLLLY